MSDKKLLVIGAGPGGYTAAFYAADRGMDVTLVDADHTLGGVCLQRGCIPSKALLHTAQLLSETRDAEAMGLDFGSPKIDLDRLRHWKNGVIRKMTGGLEKLCKQRGVKFLGGMASFKNSQSADIIGNGTVAFDHALIATGSRPICPESFQGISSRVMDSTAALDLEDIPERLLIVGGGYIGLEMGTFYAALGSRVSVVEMTDGLLPGADRDLVRVLQVRLKKEFEEIHLNTRVDSIKENGNCLDVQWSKADQTESREFDRVLIAVGRRPNTEKLELQNTSAETDGRGFLKVDSQWRTGDPNISAIGDVIGGSMLAHKASHEGIRAVDNILEPGSGKTLGSIPAIVFTDPEIAWCGLTETEAKARGVEVSLAKFPWGASGRATTLGRNDGQTKLVLEPQTGKVLGMGIVGYGAGELISEGVLAVDHGLTAEALAASIHPHPTLSETLMEAAEVFEGFPTHIFKRRR